MLTKNAKDHDILIIHNIAMVIAVLVIALGCSGIIGWHFNIESLLRYKAGTVAIVYNVSLCFILMGFSVLAVLYKLRYVSIAITFFVLVLAILGLLQNVSSADFGIDQLLFKHYDILANAYPGRMAPNTAVSFILLSLALLCINKNNKSVFSLNVGATLSILIFCLSMVFLSGYMSSLGDSEIWKITTPISMAAAIGFSLLSINIFILNFYTAKAFKIECIKSLPLILAACFFVGVLFLTEAIRYQEILYDYTSILQMTTFILGTVVAIFIGILLQVALVAINHAKNAKFSLALMRSTLEATADGLIVVDLNGDVIIYNKRFLSMFELEDEDMSCHNRQSLTKIIVPKIVNVQQYFFRRKQIALDPSLVLCDELELKNGNTYERVVKPQFLDGEIIGRVFSYRDTTITKRLEKQLLRQANYDELTGLPSKILLSQRINVCIQQSKNNNKIFGVILLDMYKFSNINNIFGRSKGDILIKDIANRLKENLPRGHMLGRIESDQFIVVTEHLNDRDMVIPLIQKLMESLVHPIRLYNHEIKMSLYAGVAFYPNDGDDKDILLTNADVAMLYAKKSGKSQFKFYSKDMSVYTMQHIELESQLNNAIEKGEFVVYYQPIIEFNTGKVVCVEALVRWQHPELGLLAPLDFIPVAEELGLINQIGQFVLMQACIQTKIWNDTVFPDLRVAVNISAVQIRSDFFIETVKSVLRKTHINPKNLDLELTESLLIDCDDKITSMLHDLADMGIGISIDDFGTGYSSFNYVNIFPIYKIKIDRSFITNVTNIEKSKAIVASMIAMAKNLGVCILAEGVETEQELQFLRDHGCDQGQGFYFSKPLTGSDLLEYISTYNIKNSI